MSTWFGGRARKSSLSRATRGSSGKGKPRLVSLLGIASSCALPTSSAGYWLPLLPCSFVSTSASDATISIGGEFFAHTNPAAGGPPMGREVGLVARFSEDSESVTAFGVPRVSLLRPGWPPHSIGHAAHFKTSRELISSAGGGPLAGGPPKGREAGSSTTWGAPS